MFLNRKHYLISWLKVSNQKLQAMIVQQIFVSICFISHYLKEQLRQSKISHWGSVLGTKHKNSEIVNFFITLYFTASHSTVWCGFASSLQAELGTLTKRHCGIFKELPNIKGEVVVAGGVLEEEDLPVVSFRPERGLGQVVNSFNVPKLFICACGSKTGHTVHWPRTLYWQTCDIVSVAVAGCFMLFHPSYICSWRTLCMG